MKILIMILILFPLVGQTQYREHSPFSSHNREGGQSLFWEDVSARQYQQEQWIERGIDSGQLTRSEVRKLHREQRKIDRLLNRYQHRHYLGKSKRRQVVSCLSDFNYLIRELKHNSHYVNNMRNSKHSKYSHRDYSDRHSHGHGTFGFHFGF